MKYKLHFKKYMIIVQKNYMFHIRRLFRHDARPGIQEHKQRMLIILDIFPFCNILILMQDYMPIYMGLCCIHLV